MPDNGRPDSLGFGTQHHGMKAEDAIRHAMGSASGEAAGSTMGGRSGITPGTSRENAYKGPDVEVGAAADNYHFTGGKVKNSITGEDYESQEDYESADKAYRQQSGPSIGRKVGADAPENTGAISKEGIEKYKQAGARGAFAKNAQGMAKSGHSMAQVQVSKGDTGEEIGTYYNGEETPQDVAEKSLSPADLAKKSGVSKSTSTLAKPENY